MTNDKVGYDKCLLCVGQAEPLRGQSACVTQAPADVKDEQLYQSIIGIFAAISLGSVVLVTILVRSRHKFSVRPFHSGICIYIASFTPYALLKVAAVARLLKANTQEDELTAGVILNATFMLFFCLGFGGKMALIQLWMHMISRHAGSHNEQSLMASARQTWSFMRFMVLVVCILYSIGFLSLVAVFTRASNACAAEADSTSCIPPNLIGTPAPECLLVVDLAHGISYYEGIFAAAVAVIFTFYAFMFNGLVYALLTSDPAFSNLTKFQRMLISNKILRRIMSPCVFYNDSPRTACNPSCQVHPAIVAASAVPDDG
jgi:hypothetical protein